MANAHVLDRSGADFRVVFHIPIPAQNNAAGVPIRTAVVNSGLGGKTILPDGDGSGGSISTTEKASIATGAIVERIVSFDPTQGGNATGQAIIDNINAEFQSVQAEVQAEVQAKLAQYGRTV